MTGEPARLVVAIDGPAGAGKSTVARMVAARLAYLYIDTGAMYRAITVKLLRLGVNLNDTAAVAEIAAHSRVDLSIEPINGGNSVFVDGINVTDLIRTPEVSAAVSTVASIPAVRAELVREQQRLAQIGGVVMDGRDIGTVVLPHADVKVFLTASLAERAQRRQRELAAQGVATITQEVANDIAARDNADSTRAVAPLAIAPDAVLIDTTSLSIESAVEAVLTICRQRLSREGCRGC